jgi:P-type Ca2+ transporter type 2C
MMRGLTNAEVRLRLNNYGPNTLPEARPLSFAAVFLRQFLSPLIYILVAAAAVAMLVGDVKDAGFIGVVLLLNGIIGAVQEYSASQAAAALRQQDQLHALVVREGRQQDVAACDLVPGDIVLLDAGRRVPADLRLLEALDLRCDESLLTGESASVRKQVPSELEQETRSGMAFAGSLVVRGRGVGEVTATGLATEVGKIASELIKPSASQPPLVIRMEQFSRLVAILVAAAVCFLMIVGYLRHMELVELFMMAVGLAVAAIPEGLPVAIAVALSIGMRRMAKANVIVRKMAAVESLGSCTMIATDKTGTLTRNELTVTEIVLADGSVLSLQHGKGLESYSFHSEAQNEQTDLLLAALLRAAALPNEAEIRRDKDEIRGLGDTVDVALLVAAHRSGVAHEEIRENYPLLKRIPYEPDLKYAASFHLHKETQAIRVFAKGAPETLIDMASRMYAGVMSVPIDRDTLWRQKDALSNKGLRVLAFAEAEIAPEPDDSYGPQHLQNMVFLGLVGMHDPLRPEVRAAVAECRNAGISVAMVTGDAPGTAAAIAREAGIDFSPSQIVTGEDIQRALDTDEKTLDSLTSQARIYARVEPIQKLAIVLSLARNGHFVAVTGDGVNDAPALKHAHVGVAMGKQGTDVAKESADIIIADDNFASIVRGVLEGRVAYANIRKVIFLLVSTGAAELLLFLLSVPLGLPIPLLPVQLLWLNLVTNGIQHVALAAEKPEGDELTYPPRKPEEPIFDRVMITRCVYSAVLMAGVGFGLFYWLISKEYEISHARNLLLLLFVIFENFQVLNARSENHSLFYRGILSSPLLVASILGAQVIQLAASHIPVIADTLRIWPPSLGEWITLLGVGASLLLTMEIEKWWSGRRTTFQPGHKTTTVAITSSRYRSYMPILAMMLVSVGAVSIFYWQATRVKTPVVSEIAELKPRETVNIPGVVLPSVSVEVFAPAAGTIEAVNCATGDRVQEGYVCGRILTGNNKEEFKRARKELAKADAALQKGKNLLDRANKRYRAALDKDLSQARLGKLRTTLDGASARIVRLQATRIRLNEELKAVQEKGLPIVAKVKGSLIESRLVNGREIDAGNWLLRLAPNEKKLRVEVMLDEAFVDRNLLGSSVFVVFSNDPSTKIMGQVREVLRVEKKVKLLVEIPMPNSAVQAGDPVSVKIELD